MYILPILLYGADTWSMTSISSRRIDAFDQWCLRHILRIPFIYRGPGLAHVTHDEVRRRTCQPPATLLTTTRRLRLFGHIARAGPSQDHSLTRGLYEQLSVVCLGTGNACLVDQDEPGFERLSSTSSSTISASTQRGSVRRNVPSGVNSWRQLCPVKDAPLDDDDE